MCKFFSLPLGIGCWLLSLSLAAAEPAIPSPPVSFVAHEWGTFTALQDDAGRELAGINIDDEPVPTFVHNLAPYLLNNPILSNEHWVNRQKGVPRQHPRVTLRLETPVIYFYPAADGMLPKQVDVSASFVGGWLTEFYPYAEAKLPGLGEELFDFGPLTPQTRGSLRWRDVQLNTRAPGPETDEQVWLAPRRVKAVDLSVTNPRGNEEGEATTESERYLFYRGVANQRAPLRVVTDREADAIQVFANFDEVLCKTTANVRAAWLVDIRPDGQLAFRRLPEFEVSGDAERVAVETSRRFSAGDYASENLKQLQSDMHAALLAEGLFEDEATAMLSTWQRAYFQTPGLRLFFTVPRVWTDHYLPLEISGEPRVTRVMIGRIELITDAQRDQLAKIEKGPVSDPRWISEIPQGAARETFLRGCSDFGDLQVKIPSDYQAYLDLGRFRNALVVEEQRRTKSPSLAKFIALYGLKPYRVAGE
jgi:hypothetical protein